MRKDRLVAGVLGVAVLGLTPVTATGAIAAPSPSAAPTLESAAVTGATTLPRADERAKPRRNLHDKSKKRGNAWFIVGRVTPDGAKRKVIVKRKVSKKAKWRNVAKVKTNRKARFSVRVGFPSNSKATWYYKLVVPGGKKYAYSPSNRIYTACRRIAC